MIDFITGVMTPAVAFVLMLCVGFELHAREFASVVRKPGMLIWGSVIQAIVPPAVAVMVVTALQVEPQVALAIVVLAICPGGALSNAYCHLARMNVALSISLTVTSALLSFVTFPVLGLLVLASLQALDIETFSFPFAESIWLLLLFVLVPVALGMALRHAIGNGSRDYRHLFRRVGFVLLLGVVGLSVLANSKDILHILSSSWLPAMVFTGGTLLAALALSRLAARHDAGTIAVEAAVRNIPVALIVSEQLTESSLVGYYLAYLLVQLPLLLIASRLFQRKFDRTPEPAS